MAIKAKLKRYKDGQWEQFNPETEVGQVNGLEQLINSLIDQNTIELTATLPSSDWTGSSPATQTVIVPGLLASDDPVIDLTYSGNYVQDTGQFYEWSKVYRITTQENAITAFAIEEPTVDINIKILVIR